MDDQNPDRAAGGSDPTEQQSPPHGHSHDQGQGQGRTHDQDQAQETPVDDMAVGDLMDVPPQDRGVSLARALLEETEGQGPPAKRAEIALQAAKARLNDAKTNLERAEYTHRVHEVAVKTIQEVHQQRTYVSDAAADLGQTLAADGAQPTQGAERNGAGDGTDGDDADSSGD